MSFKSYLTEDNKLNGRLYVDMDGVLCDWLQAAYDKTGKRYSGTVPDLEKRRIFSESFKFWETMPWTKDGKRLWNSVRRYNPYILSAYDILDPASKPGKYAWCAKNLNLAPARVILVPKSPEKAFFAKSDRVLIDDFPKNVHVWEGAGGIGIIHVNTDHTLENLSQVL